MPVELVTFDAGQTLVELDLDFLVTKLATRGVSTTEPVLAAVQPAAWRHYNEHIRAGGGETWKAFMRALLTGAEVPDVEANVEWLWDEQPKANLWRRTITDMVAVARDLKARGVKVAVLSNSEGKLVELLEQCGVADAFEVIFDSGVLGIEKPDPRIFAMMLERMHARAETTVHIGDSWAADVEGALRAGWRAVWFRTHGELGGRDDDPRVAVARDAGEVRAALARFAGDRS